MKEPIGEIPYNYATRRDSPEIPEFIFPGPPNLRWAKSGELVWGGISHIYASQNFATCSAFILRSRSLSTYGLLHASPVQHLYENSYGQLLEDFRVFEGGQVLLVEGSGSTPKPWILEEFSTELSIEHVDTISADTMKADGTSALFHVGYRPKNNQILIVRDALKDLQVYEGFPSGTSKITSYSFAPLV